MWYTKFGNAGDVVLSSRVRLARNLADLPFGAKMTKSQRDELLDRAKKALPDLKYIEVSALSDSEKTALCECHLISPDMAANKERCAVLVNNDCTVAVMVGEEDHFRIQAMKEGFSLKECLNEANRTDDELEEKENIGFSERFGYLTCCPTNVGTGMRASVMVHLPALTECGKINAVISSLAKLGITVRGIYGEGSRALGNIYQISNQVTLGVSEEETIDKMTQVVTELIEQERSLGRKLYESRKLQFEDRVCRALGTLNYSRILTSNEAMNLVSDVRWGVNLGIIKNISLETLSELLYNTMPANMVKNYNLTDPTERDMKRSELFREGLKK